MSEVRVSSAQTSTQSAPPPKKATTPTPKQVTADVRLGDCLDILKAIPDGRFDLIVTSPPYADRRTKTYGGILPDKYVEWFLPRSEQFRRVLKPTRTFILNIKEKAENGERHTYVIEL